MDYPQLMTSLKYYDTSFDNSPYIADCITKMLNCILAEYKEINYMHAIGYSLGCQIAGLLGKELKKQFGIILNRATGE